ncbi:carotenoid biosynthesis protein [Halovenus sp. WSH3]|uniref:Carotenoid biosynthesis protein n=1 Tax=Halovenus carboxidivorans TaxID=2692199 RepID=A0A6B0T206_9EURY|nr:bisanhydrobacterioruberin hydratase [Halovenus carboxidivorans]MXR52094.1 carotenoid biosynthesis protein [Halovenus carboxidivorans]
MPEPEGESTTREVLRRALSDRRAFEHSLDRLIGDNRVTIAVVFPVVGAVMLLASAEGLLPDPLAFNPWLVLCGVAVMRLPLIGGLAPLVDRRAGIALGLLVAYTYGIEYLGATTGLPYGEFSYEVSLGPMLFGTIPWALPLFFIPLVLNSYLLCVLLFGERARSAAVRLPVVAAMVVAIDLVLDPGAVALGFWEYEAGAYYGVPALNYAGWVLSSVVATALIDLAFGRTELIERIGDCEYVLDDMVSFVLLWGSISAFYGAWVPVVIAACFGAALYRLDRFDFPVGQLVPGR